MRCLPRTIGVPVLTIWLASLSASPVASAQQARMIELGPVPARAVSDDGSVIAGGVRVDDVWLAGRWTAETGMVPLAGLTVPSQTVAISGDGQFILGTAGSRVFRWSELGGLEWLESFNALDISYDGSVIVGHAATARTGPSRAEAMVWTAEAGLVELGTPAGTWGVLSRATVVSADGSVIAGNVRTIEDKEEVYRWSADTGMVMLGTLTSNYALPWAISADGSTLVGLAATADGGYTTFRWTEATGIVGIAPLTFGSNATAVTGDGSIVVGNLQLFGHDLQDSRAFMWDVTHGFRYLQDALISDYGMGEALDGWVLRRAHDISPDGRFIVGRGVKPSGEVTDWLIDLGPAVPEPTSVLLLGIAAVGLLRRCRRP